MRNTIHISKVLKPKGVLFGRDFLSVGMAKDGRVAEIYRKGAYKCWWIATIKFIANNKYVDMRFNYDDELNGVKYSNEPYERFRAKL